MLRCVLQTWQPKILSEERYSLCLNPISRRDGAQRVWRGGVAGEGRGRLGCDGRARSVVPLSVQKKVPR